MMLLLFFLLFMIGLAFRCLSTLARVDGNIGGEYRRTNSKFE
jgi:hypothetical protein